MNRLLLDTCAYSALLLSNRSILNRVQNADRVALSVISLGELQAGFLKGSKRSQNLADLDRFLALPRVEVLHVDSDTATSYAAIFDSLRRRGRALPEADLWIAATAYRNQIPLVTLDRHFLEIPQILLDLVE